MKKGVKIIIFCLLFFLLINVLLSFENYTYPKDNNLRFKMEYLDEMINDSIGLDSDFENLKTINPEFQLFTLSFAVYAMTNVALLDTIKKCRAIDIIDKSIQIATKDFIYYRYTNKNDPFNPIIDSSASILYLGHLNLMLGCYRILANDDKYSELNNRISLSLADRYKHSMNLESYDNLVWVPDNTVALASLYLNAQKTKSNYHLICADWVKYAKEKLLDNSTGLLYSTVNPETMLPIEEPRGSMVGFSMLFIYRFDTIFAKSLFQNYKTHFGCDIGALSLYKEKINCYETNIGDIDSGPLIMGYSIPANAFAFGSAIAFKDFKTAQKLKRLIGIGAKEYDFNHKIKYKVRFVDLPISPFAESIMLYLETMTSWQ